MKNEEAEQQWQVVFHSNMKAEVKLQVALMSTEVISSCFVDEYAVSFLLIHVQSHEYLKGRAIIEKFFYVYFYYIPND